MEKKNYIQPSQKVKKIRVQSMLAGSSTTDVTGGGMFIGQGPADPDGGMMARKRTTID